MISIYFISLSVFLSVILLLVFLLLLVEANVVQKGDCSVIINDDSGKSIQTPGGMTLLSALSDNNIYLPSACGGKGSCALCKCRIDEGGRSILPTELPHLSRKERLENVRLSCQVKIKEDMKIRIPPEIFNIRKYHATVVSNDNVATSNILELTIKELIKNYIEDNKKIILGSAFSSVVPELNKQYDKALYSICGIKPLKVNHKCKLNILIKYKNPEKLGVDRIANAEAALNEYGPDSIIVDIGTAITFCVICNGNFDGGIIAPGIKSVMDSFSKNTADLPDIKFDEPDSLVASDSENAIKSGFFFGWISLVDGLIGRIEKYYNREFKLIFTGGFPEKIAENISREKVIDPDLTLKGIKYIYNQNI